VGLSATSAYAGAIGAVQHGPVGDSGNGVVCGTAGGGASYGRRECVFVRVCPQVSITIQSTAVLVVLVRVSQMVRPVAVTLVTPTPVTAVPGTLVEGVATARKVVPLRLRPVIVTEVGVLAARGVMVTRPVAMFPALRVPSTVRPLEVSRAEPAAEPGGASRTRSSTKEPWVSVSAPWPVM